MSLDEKEQQRKHDLGPYWLLALLMAAKPLLLCVLGCVLLLMLLGCSAQPARPLTVPAQHLAIPLDLLMPCHEPLLQGDTYGDFVLYGAKASLALQACSARMEAVRDIVERHNAAIKESE